MSVRTIIITIIIIMLFYTFAAFVYISTIALKIGLVTTSFIAMLGAIFVLFGAYVYLSDSLEESLKATT